MLKQRLITAAILIPLAVWAVFASSLTTFTTLIVAVALLAAWEWHQMIGIQSPGMRVMLAVDLIIVLYLAITQLNPYFIISIGILIWLIALVVILGFSNKSLAERLSHVFKNKVFGAISSILILTVFVVSSITLKAFSEIGAFLFFFVMVTVWLADTGGYFAGKRFGKHALAPAVSPNKTWEGVAGGVLFASIWAIGFYWVKTPTTITLFEWLLLAVVTVTVSIVGDLFESLYKRAFSVKDSGNLLPGHGGILDRIDSLIAAVPVFTFLMLIMGGYK
ncbi:MAG TPA: phosphatidate cytidylyltransferase [Methylophaga aminisulfidivorans]|uniref:phosphatidate cytidylyltransferase n=1 Tax=Methylophaga TaxID=40222 RepID=UPI0017595353|nr:MULTISPECIES: phosphatidate cytidylyltransferase [Methylophaga]HIC47935.1 phosphatidate cytidylyltransferase [Methylophaga sp.]HIM40872.1 phosphatidate cytidylyltransferase [Methylophaga aminisulfidivorans]